VLSVSRVFVVLAACINFGVFVVGSGAGSR